MKSGQSFGYTLLVSLIAAGTTWAALMAWRGFLTDSGSYLAPLAVTAIVIGASGAVLRWLGSPAIVTAPSSRGLPNTERHQANSRRTASTVAQKSRVHKMR